MISTTPMSGNLQQNTIYMHDLMDVAQGDESEAKSGIDEGPPPGSKGVTVLYGTEYGFSKEIAEKLAQRLKEGSQFWYACQHM